MTLDDVSAVVLSVGEPYTRRALASVERQAAPPAEVIVIRDRVPFHRALNEGAARVRTAYFVQVDADMVLDPTCCSELRGCMAAGVGVVIGHLRDPLLRRVAGIKLFRAACFREERFPDSISPDTDFGNAVARRGWATVYAIKPAEEPGGLRHVFGDHLPDYTPLYTFRKYELLGARHRYRRAARSLRELFRALFASRHESALLAVIGAARGVSLPAETDLLVPERGGADFGRLASFLGAAGGIDGSPSAVPTVAASGVREAWTSGYRRGMDLYRRRAPDELRGALAHLGAEESTAAWVALVGICHGLFADEFDAAEVERALTLVNQVLPYPHRLRLDAAT